MKKIMITGANGFIGRHLMNEFAKHKNLKLIPVIRKKFNFKNNLKQIERNIICKDIFSKKISWWRKQCKDIDIIIHLAWYVKKNYLYSEKNLNCLSGSIQLASGAILAGVKKFVGIGTCLEYDISNKPLSINTRLKPTFPYSIAKTALYFYLLNYFSAYNTKFSWCRIFYLFGEGEKKNRLAPYVESRISQGKSAIINNSEYVRDFLDIKKAVKKIVKISLDNNQGQFNICSGKAISIKKFVTQIAQKYNKIDLLIFKKKKNKNDLPYIIGVP
jgi:dTDP-6-deoxy-L-talose 4-dehydrogenase (NAD+)